MRNPHPLKPRLRRRPGRLLVESCVAIVLLASGSTVVLLVASGSARLVDSARQHDAVERGTATTLAPLLAAPCAAQAGTVRYAPRVGLDFVVTTARQGAVHAASVEATWFRSPLALAQTPGSAPLSAQQRHHSAGAAWCQP